MTITIPILLAFLVAAIAVAAAVTYLAMRGRTPMLEAKVASTQTELKVTGSPGAGFFPRGPRAFVKLRKESTEPHSKKSTST